MSRFSLSIWFSLACVCRRPKYCGLQRRVWMSLLGSSVRFVLRMLLLPLVGTALVSNSVAQPVMPTFERREIARPSTISGDLVNVALGQFKDAKRQLAIAVNGADDTGQAKGFIYTATLGLADVFTVDDVTALCNVPKSLFDLTTMHPVVGPDQLVAADGNNVYVWSVFPNLTPATIPRGSYLLAGGGRRNLGAIAAGEISGRHVRWLCDTNGPLAECSNHDIKGCCNNPGFHLCNSASDCDPDQSKPSVAVGDPFGGVRVVAMAIEFRNDQDPDRVVVLCSDASGNFSGSGAQGAVLDTPGFKQIQATVSNLAFGSFWSPGSDRHDLVVASAGTPNTLHLIKNKGLPTDFETSRMIPGILESLGSISVDDLNGDGHDDIIAGLYSGRIAIYLGTGNGQFDGPHIISVFSDGRRLDEIVVGDLNGDGKADIVLGSRGSNSPSPEIDVLLNTTCDPTIPTCMFEMPVKVRVPARGGQVVFAVSATDSRCQWLVPESDPFDWARTLLSGNRLGSGEVGLIAATNTTGNIRSRIIALPGTNKTIVIEQARSDECEFDVTPNHIEVGLAGGDEWICVSPKDPPAEHASFGTLPLNWKNHCIWLVPEQDACCPWIKFDRPGYRIGVQCAGENVFTNHPVILHVDPGPAAICCVQIAGKAVTVVRRADGPPGHQPQPNDPCLLQQQRVNSLQEQVAEMEDRIQELANGEPQIRRDELNSKLHQLEDQLRHANIDLENCRR